MAIPRFPDPKDPEDVADFSLSFAEAMPADDTIAGIDLVEITANTAGAASTAPELALASSLFTGQTATLWLNGGKAAWRYEISVLLHTAGGRTLRRRALLDVRPL